MFFTLKYSQHAKKGKLEGFSLIQGIIDWTSGWFQIINLCIENKALKKVEIQNRKTKQYTQKIENETLKPRNQMKTALLSYICHCFNNKNSFLLNTITVRAKNVGTNERNLIKHYAGTLAELVSVLAYSVDQTWLAWKFQHHLTTGEVKQTSFIDFQMACL